MSWILPCTGVGIRTHPSALHVDYKKTPTGPHGTYRPGLYAGDQAQKSETISPSSDFFRKGKKQVAEKYAI